MFLLDRMLVGGLRFVMKQVLNAAEQEGPETPDALRERLLRAQMQYELGEIDDFEFSRIEREVMAGLRAARGTPAASGPITFSSSDRVQVDFAGGADREDEGER